MTKHSTMLKRNPAMYVKAMARLIAHGAFTAGSLISSVICAVASELDVSQRLGKINNMELP